MKDLNLEFKAEFNHAGQIIFLGMMGKITCLNQNYFQIHVISRIIEITVSGNNKKNLNKEKQCN